MAMTDSVLLWILLMVWLVPFALFILLQIFLCRKENKWLGLILPAISFLGSLVFYCRQQMCGQWYFLFWYQTLELSFIC